jgi:hypothetical protein
MAINPQWIWIAAAVIVVLAVIAILATSARRTRTARLRETFGTEYDALSGELGPQRAEEEMRSRVAEAKTIRTRPLSAEDRDRFQQEWARIEAHFIERPAMAVSEADELIDQILRAEGYPLGDYRRHLAHLSLRHPRLAEHYRAGHAIIHGHQPGKTTTEDLRQAMLHFRSLLDEILGPSDVARAIPVESEIPVTTARERVRAQEAADRSEEDIVR